MTNICGLCWGAGFLFVSQNHKFKWFHCPNCNGVGTLVCDGPPTIRIHWKKNNKLDQFNRKMQTSENCGFIPKSKTD